MANGVLLSEAIGLIADAKRAANRRAAYVKELVRCLNSFVRAVGDIPIESAGTHHIESFLATKGPNSWTRATQIARLSTLFEFARRRRWLVENPCEFLERVSLERSVPSILSPEQAAALVAHCLTHRPRGLAWLALCLFAGVRPQEASALTWSDIDFDAQRIFIRPAIAKVRRQRIVQPPEACFRLLARARDIPNALPFPAVARRRLQRKLRELMGWPEWKADILRHTCASMWLALLPDAGRVALQLGNSPSILLRHYHALTTPEEAARFWGI